MGREWGVGSVVVGFCVSGASWGRNISAAQKGSKSVAKSQLSTLFSGGLSLRGVASMTVLAILTVLGGSGEHLPLL